MHEQVCVGDGRGRRGRGGEGEGGNSGLFERYKAYNRKLPAARLIEKKVSRAIVCLASGELGNIVSLSAYQPRFGRKERDAINRFHCCVPGK